MHMNKLAVTLSLAVSSFSLGGCATVINGTSQDIGVASEPSGAKVTLSNGTVCQATPCEFSLKRRYDLKADYELEGYQPVSVYVQSRTGGAGIGNILAGGIIGAGVDASNGSMNSLFPKPIYVRMVPVGSAEEAVILDKDGKVLSTVAAHNAKVTADVEEGLAEQVEKARKKEMKEKK